MCRAGDKRQAGRRPVVSRSTVAIRKGFEGLQKRGCTVRPIKASDWSSASAAFSRSVNTDAIEGSYRQFCFSVWWAGSGNLSQGLLMPLYVAGLTWMKGPTACS